MDPADTFYEMIFKRKSFHLFRGVGEDHLTPEELHDIDAAWRRFAPLYPETRTALRIVPAARVNFKRDAEYCILIYSEKKENYLMNVGYLGEQLDLWLTAHDIGSLWYGIGKPDETTCDGLDFVIMFAVHKVNDPAKFRQDLFRAKRRPTEEVWSGDDPGVADIARFAPSACNSQPWYVESRDGTLTVRRHTSRRGIMPPHAAIYFNRIDIGIYLCFLELCLEKNGTVFERTLLPDDGAEKAEVAVYRLRGESK